MDMHQDQKAIQLTPQLREYLLQMGVREPDILKKLREQTANMPERNMQILPEQGQFISMLVKILNPQRVLEIGTYTGYSSLCMALALPDVRITAVDKNAEWTKIAQKYWQNAGVSNRIKLIIGPALDTLKTFNDQSFDLVFIDADKRNYINYYEESLRIVKENGIILIDNILWRGRVIDLDHDDLGTQTIRKLNDFVSNDSRVDICMLPLGDGLTVARKK
jgi:predicted O-methyltransferase YrrM